MAYTHHQSLVLLKMHWLLVWMLFSLPRLHKSGLQYPIYISFISHFWPSLTYGHCSKNGSFHSQSSTPRDLTTNILAQSRNEMVTNVKTPKAIEIASTVGPCDSTMINNIIDWQPPQSNHDNPASTPSSSSGWSKEEIRPNALKKGHQVWISNVERGTKDQDRREGREHIYGCGPDCKRVDSQLREKEGKAMCRSSQHMSPGLAFFFRPLIFVFPFTTNGNCLQVKILHS